MLVIIIISANQPPPHEQNQQKTFSRSFSLSLVYIFNIQFFIFCIKYLCGARAPVPLFWRVSPVLSSKFVGKKKLLPSPERGLIMKGEKTKKLKKKSRQKLIKHGKTRGGGEEDFRGMSWPTPETRFCWEIHVRNRQGPTNEGKWLCVSTITIEMVIWELKVKVLLLSYSRRFFFFLWLTLCAVCAGASIEYIRECR